MPPARVACGQGLPGITARSGSLDPALASGTVTATADLKFSRGSRSLVVSSARLIAAHGTVSLQIKIGGRYVPLATITPPVRKVVRTVSDISVSGELMLTRPGADALGRTLGTSLRTGSALCAFGGNVVFTQADVSSGSATFSLPSSVTVTPVAPASGSGSTLHLPVRASVVGLSTIASLNGVVRVSGGATLQLGGRTITLSALSVTLNGNQVNRRIDVLHASVAGGRAIAFADLSMGNGGPSDTNATETDAESVKLTGAGAAALGPSLHAGSSFGSILLSATVGR